VNDIRQWRKSSHSGTNANCLEVCIGNKATVAVRDSKDVTGPELEFTRQAWTALVEAVKQGRLGL
jgi:hypothetical protein